MMVAKGNAVLAAAQTSTVKQVTDTLRWRFGHPWPSDSPGTLAFRALFDEIKERTKGLFSIEMAEMAAEGHDQSDALRLVAHEELFDLIFHFPPYVARDEPLFETAIVPLHGLVDEADNAKVIDVQREIAVEIAADWDLEFISFQHVSGAEKRVYLFSKLPVRSIEDLKKTNLRHWSQLSADVFNSIGVPTRVIPSSELYAALRDGTVDAAVFPANYAATAALDKVTQYAAYITPFIASTPSGFVTRKETWAALPAAFKAVWTDVMNEHVQQDIASYEADLLEPEILRDLKSRGMTILDPLPEPERQLLQRTTLRQWHRNAEKQGPRALGYCNRIMTALDISPD